MNKIPPEIYNLRVIVVTIVNDLLTKKLFLTEKDSLQFVLIKSHMNNVNTGFPDPTLVPFEKIYSRYLKFKEIFNQEQILEQSVEKLYNVCRYIHEKDLDNSS